MPSRSSGVLPVTAMAWLLLCVASASAQPATETPPSDQSEAEITQATGASAPEPTTPADPVARQAELDANLSKLLSGATLEGSFTMTAAGGDPGRLRSEKYTLGEVSKIGGKMWRFQTRIQYGDNDVTVPIVVPIEWAADTPVVTIDDFTIPGMGTFSARVMFFAGHYSGWWQHGPRGGNLFGVIRPAGEEAAAAETVERPAQ